MTPQEPSEAPHFSFVHKEVRCAHGQMLFAYGHACADYTGSTIGVGGPGRLKVAYIYMYIISGLKSRTAEAESGSGTVSSKPQPEMV